MDDVFSAALSVVFNLAVAWWLLASRSLTLRAYPATPIVLDHSQLPIGRTVPTFRPSQSSELTAMESAEKRLTDLVGKPKSV
jgi:hypothetical protein